MSLRNVAEGVWIDENPVSIVGMSLRSTMTVLRVPDGLLVHSPVPLTPERRAEVEALGPVTHLYAPNTYHHMWIGDWAAAFPAARVHAPAGLATKRPDLVISSDALSNLDVDEIPVRGFLLEERVLVYRPAKVLVMADLVHNIGRPPELWTRVYAGAMGFYGKVALSRLLRWAAFSDRAAARRSVDEILDHPFETLIVGHGEPVCEGAREVLAEACAWLPRGGVEREGVPARLTGAPCG